MLVDRKIYSGRVYTHSGKAHLDELFAIALINAHMVEVNEIFRVSSLNKVTPVEGDIVVDIGERLGVYNGVHYIDHHQDKTISCSAVLVSQIVGKAVTSDTNIAGMLGIIDKIDREGTKGLSNHLNSNQQACKDVMHLLGVLPKWFEKDPMAAVNHFTSVLKDRLNVSKNATALKEKIQKKGKVVYVGSLKVFVVPDPNKFREELDKTIFLAAQGNLVKQDHIDVLVAWNERDEFKTRRILLYNNGIDFVDFQKIATNTKVAFCHPKMGLINLIPETSDESCLELIQKSVKEQN